MNKAFLEDLEKAVGMTVPSFDPNYTSASHILQLYIAEKLWSIEQLLKNQEQR